MPPRIRAIFAPVTMIALLLAATEATAYWWMHPAAVGLDDPVLTYTPRLQTIDSPAGEGTDAIHSTITPLPEIVDYSLPSLRCSTGSAARIDRDDGVTIHLAFFEWNQADSANALEAFRHLPEECMGTIGIKLTETLPPRSHTFGGETVWFDHTVFRDPRGQIIHAFKGTWVSGASNLIGPSFRGGSSQWRQIHWKAALHRFRPAHARVAQGAVRGLYRPDDAWQAFQSAMFPNLEMN